MLVLGIETATKTGGVALLSERGVLAEHTSNIEITHSERLMATVDRVLQDAGVSIKDVEGFCVSAGPGSFTGLRIGIAAVKGLALVMHKPVAAVPTLMALAWNLPHAGYPVCPVLDARKNEVYAALFRFEEGSVRTEMPETVITLERLRDMTTGTILFTGEGSVLFLEDIRSVMGGRAIFAPLSATVPSAASVAELGRSMLLAGAQVDPDGLAPIYVRRPEAEVAWEKRQRSR